MQVNASKPHFNAAADDTLVEVGTGMHNLHSFEGQNPNAADMWLNIWDAELADVTVGVDDPTISYLLPAGDGTLYGASDKDFTAPLGLAKGFTYAVTDDPMGGSAPSAPCIIALTYRKVRL